jgi:hypothetical protein
MLQTKQISYRRGNRLESPYLLNDFQVAFHLPESSGTGTRTQSICCLFQDLVPAQADKQVTRLLGGVARNPNPSRSLQPPPRPGSPSCHPKEGYDATYAIGAADAYLTSLSQPLAPTWENPQPGALERNRHASHVLRVHRQLKAAMPPLTPCVHASCLFPGGSVQAPHTAPILSLIAILAPTHPLPCTRLPPAQRSRQDPRIGSSSSPASNARREAEP